MPFHLRPALGRIVNRNAIYQNLTLLLCIFFGLALIAETQAVGDGGWLWYAIFFRSGQHLYSDMHLVLQPLFVLETSWFMSLFGDSWLATKVPAVLHVIAYCIGLALVARQSNLTDRQKALILACAFFVSIDFEPYRFDDYHVLADCFQVYSLVALLTLNTVAVAWRRNAIAAVLGVLAGLSMMTRLNDGAALALGVVFALLCFVPFRRLLSITIFAVATALTAIATVALTGDSLSTYANTSIFHAAGSKGGAANVLAYPLQLPWNTLRFLKGRQDFELVLYLLGSALIWVFLIRPFWKSRRLPNLIKLLIGLLCVALPLRHFHGALRTSQPIIDLSAIGVLLTYGLGLAVFVRFLLWLFHAKSAVNWNRFEILLLIPLGQLASASMSSGGRHIGLYGPIAIMILLLPIASPIRLNWEPARAFAFVVVAILVVHCATYKYRYPYLWHSYQARTLFVDRQWFRHPDYGPMIIERDQLQFIKPICDAVRSDGAQTGLLSLPFSYPNYFCDIPPWHGYIQTFFDTSSASTIFGLMDQLQKDPPKWIVYQRQLNNLAMHEQIFNQGKPLPQRYLDQMIEDKIHSGQWTPVYTSTFGSHDYYTNQWILLRTTP